MKVLLCLAALTLFVAVCHGCDSTMDCTTACGDGYHSQCVNSVCTCPGHKCTTPKDCPQGSGSGCPPFCTTECKTGACNCKWPGKY